MAELVEVLVDSVRVSLMSPQRLVGLRQVDAERYLPIWVGPYEAEAISVALQQIEMARPLTHDLLNNVLGLFNARLIRSEIIALRDDIFYGLIVVEVEGRTIEIDSRPSDAIAMAVRAHVPILAHAEVMDLAAITPDQDLRTQLPPSSVMPAVRSDSATKTEDSSRLSIFEDFLTKLDKKKPDDSDGTPASE